MGFYFHLKPFVSAASFGTTSAPCIGASLGLRVVLIMSHGQLVTAYNRVTS